MKIFTTKCWSVACLLAAAATAHAQAPAPTAQTGTEASTTFKHWDKNNDNTLSTAEFAAGWQEIQTANTLRNLHDNFVVKDTDRNGSLGSSEYLKLDLIQQAGTSAPPMATFDADKNQALDFKEYVGMIGTLVRAKPKPQP